MGSTRTTGHQILAPFTQRRCFLEEAGQNVSAWAKQQACRQQALQMPVDVVAGFDDLVVGRDEVRAATWERCQAGRIDDGLARVTEVVERWPLLAGGRAVRPGQGAGRRG